MSDVTWNPAGDDDTSFGPLTAHNVLGGRTAADAHPAAAVSYDNDVSGLTGDTVQEAIDELATSGGAVASVNGQTGVVVLDAGDVGAVPVESVGLLPGETNRGTWDVAATYAVGDVVAVSGSVYVASAASTGLDPASNPGSWDVLDPTGRRIQLGPAATAGDYGLSVGPGATSGDYGTSVGPVATAGDYGTSVGPVATSGGGGLSVGYGATAGDFGTSVGPGATAGDFGTSVGLGATAGDYEVNVANTYRATLDPGDPTTPTGATIATGFVDLPETADATNPAADHQRLIARTDGIYVRDESGTEVGPLGAAHAASHQDGGSDELALDASQITAGTVPAARLGAAASGPLTGRLFAGWHAAPGQTAGNITSPFTAAGDLICYPQYMWAGTYTFAGNAYYYNTGTATLRLGLYDSTGTNGGPGALVSDFGTMALVAGSGGAERSISISLTLATSGHYWPSILCDAYTSAPRFVGYSPTGVGPIAFVPGAAFLGDSNGFSAIKRIGVTTGAMPATWGTPTALATGAPVVRFYLS